MSEYRTEAFLAMLPDPGKRMADMLEYRPRTLEHHPLVNPPDYNPDAKRRERTIRQAWWHPVCECERCLQLTDDSRMFTYQITIRTNQPLCRGDVEAIFTHGVPAMHLARGEKIPDDSIHLPDEDDGKEP